MIPPLLARPANSFGFRRSLLIAWPALLPFTCACAAQRRRRRSGDLRPSTFVLRCRVRPQSSSSGPRSLCASTETRAYTHTYTHVYARTHTTDELRIQSVRFCRTGFDGYALARQSRPTPRALLPFSVCTRVCTRGSVCVCFCARVYLPLPSILCMKPCCQTGAELARRVCLQLRLSSLFRLSRTAATVHYFPTTHISHTQQTATSAHTYPKRPSDMAAQFASPSLTFSLCLPYLPLPFPQSSAWTTQAQGKATAHALCLQRNPTERSLHTFTSIYQTVATSAVLSSLSPPHYC